MSSLVPDVRSSFANTEIYNRLITQTSDRFTAYLKFKTKQENMITMFSLERISKLLFPQTRFLPVRKKNRQKVNRKSNNNGKFIFRFPWTGSQLSFSRAFNIHVTWYQFTSALRTAHFSQLRWSAGVVLAARPFYTLPIGLMKRVVFFSMIPATWYCSISDKCAVNFKLSNLLLMFTSTQFKSMSGSNNYPWRCSIKLILFDCHEWEFTMC